MADGHLSDAALAPDALPPGWAARMSRSVGLRYFVERGAGGADGPPQWLWPVAQAESSDEEAEDAELPEPDGPGAAEAGRAPYMERTAFGDVSCLLCGRSGQRHLESPMHQRALSGWRALSDAFSTMQVELVRDVGASAGGVRNCKELLVAWRGELRFAVKRSEAALPVKAAFWHRCALPRLQPGVGGGFEEDLVCAVGAVVALSRAKEPPPGLKDVAPAPGSLSLPGHDPASRIEAAEAAGREARARLLPGSEALAADTAEGLQALLAAMQQLRAALAACQRPPSAAVHSLAAAENAVLHARERPARERNARDWLADRGLLHCAELLRSQGLLVRLPEVALADVAEGAGVPERCREVIARGASGGRLTEADLAPRQVPPGWRRLYSRSVGLHYFQEVGGAQASQWEWPLPAGEVQYVPQPALMLPPEPQRLGEGAPLAGAAPYVEYAGGLAAEWSCLLCGAAGAQHLASAAHGRSVAAWAVRLARLDAVLAGIRRAGLAGCDRTRQLGLLEAWHGEILLATKDAEGVSDEVARALWHRCVSPALPEVTVEADGQVAVDVCALLAAALARALAAARAPEPSAPP